MVSSTPRPHFTPGKDPVPILQEAGWAPGPVWTGGKSRPHRDSIPDRPVRSQLLYRLSYQAHIYIYIYIYVYVYVCVCIYVYIYIYIYIYTDICTTELINLLISFRLQCIQNVRFHIPFTILGRLFLRKLEALLLKTSLLLNITCVSNGLPPYQAGFITPCIK